MKILHITGDANFGGIGRLVLTLVQQQLVAGAVTPSILFSYKRGEFLDRFKRTGVRLWSVDCKSGYDVSVKKYKIVRDIYKQFDVLHFHNFNPFLAWCAVQSGKKIVYTEHGIFGYGRKTTLSDRVKRRMLRKFLNSHVDHLSFNSEFTRCIAESRYGLSETNRSTLYNGVDPGDVTGNPEHIKAIVKNRLTDKFVVGTCSRFAGFKRIDRLIKAYSVFQESKDNVVLLLVGDGDLRPELEKMVTNLGLQKSVVFTGYMENSYDYQSVMDICIYPSMNEPFGLVAVESLLLGKPVLVFRDGGGLCEIVTGISAADVVDDVDALGSRIEYYYKHQDKLRDNSNMRKKYAGGFSAESMEAGFVDIYKNLEDL